MRTPFRIWSRTKRGLAGVLGIPMKPQKPPLVVSFPKSGRTWLQMMLEGLGVEAEYTHDRSAHVDRVPVAELSTEKRMYRNRRIIFLIRDPRDTVVSGYFQSTRRVGAYEGDIRDFIRDERHGIEKIVKFNSDWLQARSLFHKGFLVVRYEDLHADVAGQLRRIVKFLGLRRVSRETLESVAAANQFERMQEREKAGEYTSKYGKYLTPGDVSDPESFKVRRGKVGGFVDYLDAADVSYCEDAMRRFKFDDVYALDSRGA